MTGYARTVLGPEARAVCQELPKLQLLQDFYLAGGTGLALQIGHRHSVDLDFFLANPSGELPSRVIMQRIQRAFGQARARLAIRDAGQLSWMLDGVLVTFAAYPFALLHPLVPGSELSPVLGGFSLASPMEIALMKAYALGRRATFRDYIDLYYVLKLGITSLSQIIEDAERKFILDGEQLFSVKLFLEQLAYTADVEDRETAVRLVRGQRLEAQEVEAYLQDAARAFIRQKTGGEEDLP
ncbi:MAG: nucleotidyl transferase AbiEii/AbiGii toxin family protein [Bacillota bacterium]